MTLAGSSGTVSFKYDPFGRRIYKSSSTATSVYAYDGDNLIEETNASGVVVARYSQWLNIDEPLAMLRSSASFYHADGLGTVTSLSNAAGALAQTYTFDSFGKQTATSGSLTNPFQYTGRESDSETGLYYYRARYYDPQTARFLNEDPTRYAGGNVNFYPYASNAPTRLIDPVGLATVTNNTGSPILVWGEPRRGARYEWRQCIWRHPAGWKALRRRRQSDQELRDAPRSSGCLLSKRTNAKACRKSP